MKQDYDYVITHIINDYEGGYGWNKSDPGGPTKYGITCYDLANHRHQKMTSMTTWAPIVKAMTLQEALDIYQIKYANGIDFDKLPAGIDMSMIDYGINSGNSRSIKVAQALMKLPQTGVFNQNLLEAIQKTDTLKFIDNFNTERLSFLERLPTWPVFKGGWSIRITDVKTQSTKLAKEGGLKPLPTVNTKPPEEKISPPKAIHVPDPNIKPKAVGGWIVLTTGLAGIIHSFQNGINFPIIIGIAAIIGFGAVIYYLIHHASVNHANQTVIIPTT